MPLVRVARMLHRMRDAAARAKDSTGGTSAATRSVDSGVIAGLVPAIQALWMRGSSPRMTIVNHPYAGALGAALTMTMAAIIIRLALPVPDPGVDSFARYAAVERPFLVPERSIPIPVDPVLVHPGWCQPATASICQEI